MNYRRDLHFVALASLLQPFILIMLSLQKLAFIFIFLNILFIPLSIGLVIRNSDLRNTSIYCVFNILIVLLFLGVGSLAWILMFLGMGVSLGMLSKSQFTPTLKIILNSLVFFASGAFISWLVLLLIGISFQELLSIFEPMNQLELFVSFRGLLFTGLILWGGLNSFILERSFSNALSHIDFVDQA